MWWQVELRVSPQIEESLSNFLFELGSTGCQQQEDRLTAYFSEEISPESLRSEVERYLSQLRRLGLAVPGTEVTIRQVPEQDWNALWKEGFHPFRLSERLWVKPTWEELQEPVSGLVLEIDPGQAFGTGHHATTRMALRFLDRHVTPGDTVLDVGTGSGILAIAAARLGAARVLALDVDPVAVACATENCLRNRVSDRIHLFVGELNAVTPGVPFDLVVANLNKRIILAHWNALLERVAAAGRLFLTGLLVEDEPEVIDMARRARFQIAEKQTEEEWLGLTLKREETR